MVVTLILLSQGRGEGVVMATPILLLEGRRQGDYGPLPPSLLGKWKGFAANSGKEWERCGPWPMASLFQKEGWKVTMLRREGGGHGHPLPLSLLALTFSKQGGLWPWSSSFTSRWEQGVNNGRLGR